MRKNIIFLASIIVSFLFSSCEKIENDWVDGQGLIQLKGEYKTYDNNLLIVEEIEGKLSYLLKNKNQLILESDYKFSSLHKWYLIYNKQGLWLYSGDIGIMYWKKNIDSKFNQVLLNKDNINEYLEIMPETLRKDIKDW